MVQTPQLTSTVLTSHFRTISPSAEGEAQQVSPTKHMECESLGIGVLHTPALWQMSDALTR
jgi:hypothetical protein